MAGRGAKGTTFLFGVRRIASRLHRRTKMKTVPFVSALLLFAPQAFAVLVTLHVDPSATTPPAQKATSNHLVQWETDVTSNGLLFIAIGGTGSTTAEYRTPASIAASRDAAPAFVANANAGMELSAAIFNV